MITRFANLVFDSDNPENHVLVYADCLFKLSTVVDAEGSGKAPSVGGLALQEFTKLAYPPAGHAEAGFSDKTKTILRQKLNAALARFVKRPEDFGDFCGAIMSIDSSSVEMDDELQAELLEALEKVQELTSPKKTKGDKSGALQGLALLYAVAILQLYNEEPDAIEILNDLKQCYEKLLVDDEGDVSALLVEILLAMVARPSSLMRQTAERVFEGFTSLMTSEALALLTDPLAANENAEGLRSLFDTDADMEDAERAGGSDEDDEDSEIASDVEFVDMEDAEEGEEAEEGDEDEDEEDEDEEDEEDGADDQYKELDDALANLLNSHRLDKDKDAASSDDGSDMSDSEMIALDDKISAAFQSRMKDTKKKKDHKDAKETVTNFKHRALDLLAIFARREPASPLTFELLVPLLQLMHTTKTKDLARKAGHIITELPKTLKKAKSGGGQQDEDEDEDTDTDTDEQMHLLRSVHEQAARDDSHAYAKAASTASLLVVARILGRDAGLFPAIWAEYGGLARRWAAGGGFQFPSLMGDFTNWIQTHPSLVPPPATVEAVEEEEEDEDED